MKARERLGHEGLELLACQRLSAENVHLPKEADIGNAIRAGSERARTGVDERIRQNEREASGAAPIVHDAGENDRLGEHVGANARHRICAVFGREGGRVAGVIIEKPGVDRRVEVVARRAGMGGRGSPIGPPRRLGLRPSSIAPLAVCFARTSCFPQSRPRSQGAPAK